ncbi:MAG: ComF family protein [Acidobacteria bacterium]|nr:ComF family protein [Acidobacteriota bacterium]
MGTLSSAALAILDSIASVLWPDRCVLCQSILETRREAGVCRLCLDAIPAISPSACCNRCGYPLEIRPAGPPPALCPVCRETPPPYAGARSWAVYEGAARDLVHHFKFERKARLHLPLAGLLARCLSGVAGDWAPDVVTAVPLHPSRRRERGFDQSVLLARRLARLSGLPYRALLKKRRPTPPQSLTGPEARRANISGAYAARDGRRPPGSVLLVDDVHTTGATVEECVKVLRDAGVTDVFVLTLCRVRVGR